jgi:hypothetical protein
MVVKSVYDSFLDRLFTLSAECYARLRASRADLADREPLLLYRKSSPFYGHVMPLPLFIFAKFQMHIAGMSLNYSSAIEVVELQNS